MDLVALAIIALVFAYLVKYAQSWVVRIRLGLPGPAPPLPYIGDLVGVFKDADRHHEYQLELLQKYGRNVAYTLYGTVYVLVSDPEVIKAVTIKYFDYFSGVESQGLQLKNPPFNSMISVSGPRWRRIRNTISPIFTTSMLKHMMVLMRGSVQTLVSKVGMAARQNAMVDAHAYSRQATLEVVLSTSFSIDSHAQTDDDPILDIGMKGRPKVRFLQFLASLPFGKHLISLFPDPLNAVRLIDIINNIIKERRQNKGQNRRDFVALLLRANEQADEDKKLSENEILAQSLIFLFAGFDSTSSAVAFMLYCMAMHPDIQTKIQEEIDGVWKDTEKEEVTYEMLTSLPYFDMCFQESQRLFSALHLTQRLCVEDCDIQGIPFKKGMVAVLPIYAIHRLPEVWPDPEKFDPERFSVEEKNKRSPYVFMPWGHGPRNCIGSRFAILNVKIMLVELLKRFVVVKSEKTMDPLKVGSTFTLNLPPGSMTVRFRKRS